MSHSGRMRLMLTLVALLALMACDGERDIDSAASTARPGVRLSLTKECPPPSTEPELPSNGILPDGAVMVRVCVGPRKGLSSQVYSQYDDVPLDALHTGVQSLVGVANAQPLFNPAPKTYCAQSGEGFVPLTMWFGYPDGTALALNPDLVGCDVFYAGPTTKRENYSDVFQAFASRLHQQRTAESDVPNAGTSPPRCSKRYPLTSPLDVTAAEPLASLRVCHSLGTRAAHGVLAPRWLRARFNASMGGSASATWCRSRPPWLLGVTSWGDTVRFWPKECGVYVLFGYHAEWHLTTGVQRRLEALVR